MIFNDQQKMNRGRQNQVRLKNSRISTAIAIRGQMLRFDNIYFALEVTAETPLHLSCKKEHPK